FRPRENFKRMNRTSMRMCLPELDVEEVFTAFRNDTFFGAHYWLPGGAHFRG
ncbi:MAG TPA: branched chain amino acid aminotransferase, partial [Alphaproteobacteria bacterium]|nr:branched chain amino acid aminotransferase [Alphaproteobacteria bacterium]